MNRRTTFILTLGALVTAAIVIVYAWQPKPEQAQAQQSEITKTPDAPKSSAPEAAPDTTKTPEAAKPNGTQQQILYDPKSLPAAVKQTLQEIFETAQSGDIDAMRPVLEENELKPMVAATHVDDPVAFWKQNSADGEGRDVLAALVNILSTGYVKSGQGNDAIYIWPYLAEMDLTKLTPAQEVELYRIVPADKALAMKKSGKYTYYRIGVSPTGVWQYFLQ
jgi:type II secretory pathway component PulM